MKESEKKVVSAVALREAESIIRCNNAEADYHISESSIIKVTEKLRKIELDREAQKDAIANAGDFRNGHLTFACGIDDESTLQITEVLRRLSRLYPKRPIHIDLNSPGGSIIHTFAILDQMESLKREGIKINMAVRGAAASGGCVLLQGANHRTIGPNSFLMLHRASFKAEGSADQVEDEVEQVKTYEAQMYRILAKRTGKTQDFWKKKLGGKKDVWFTAEEALSHGLVDAIG